MNYRYTPEEIGELNATIDRLRAELTRLLKKHGEQQTADVLAGTNEQNAPRRCCSNYPSCYCDQESPEHK